MKINRKRAVRKERLSRDVKLNIATNCALSLLIFSVGIVCLFPVDSAVTTDGSESNVYRCAPSETDGVSLMFNVYWGTDEVYRILDILDEHEAKATFFIGGCWADDNAACVKEILSRGHDLGNHGYFHKDHASLSEAENKEEISLCNRFIELMTAKKMTLFAPPRVRESGARGLRSAEYEDDPLVPRYDRLAGQERGAYLHARHEEHQGRGVCAHAPHEGNGGRPRRHFDILSDLLAPGRHCFGELAERRIK